MALGTPMTGPHQFISPSLSIVGQIYSKYCSMLVWTPPCKIMTETHRCISRSRISMENPKLLRFCWKEDLIYAFVIVMEIYLFISRSPIVTTMEQKLWRCYWTLVQMY